MPLSEHEYCVAIAAKMTEQVQQWICIQFCVNLEHSPMETIQMVQKAAAMDNWLLAASSQQYALSRITSHAEFFGKTSSHPGDSVPLEPRFGTPWLLTFPQTKITSEREEISEHQWGSGKYDGAADADWENCVRSPRCLLWRGLKHHCPTCNISCIFFSKCLFSCYMAGNLLDRRHISALSSVARAILSHKNQEVGNPWGYFEGWLSQ